MSFNAEDKILERLLIVTSYPYTLRDYQFYVSCDEAERWCKTSCEGDYYFYNPELRFRNEKDMLLFKLTFY